MTTRPRSLAEVATRSMDSTTFHLHLAEFLDAFRRERRPGMLAGEPRRLAPIYEGGDVSDAYLAAVAVCLAREIRAPPPAWAWDESRKLRRPWFAWPGAVPRAQPFRQRERTLPCLRRLPSVRDDRTGLPA